jgi:hypothetical protein
MVTSSLLLPIVLLIIIYILRHHSSCNDYGFMEPVKGFADYSKSNNKTLSSLSRNSSQKVIFSMFDFVQMATLLAEEASLKRPGPDLITPLRFGRPFLYLSGRQLCHRLRIKADLFSLSSGGRQEGENSIFFVS